MHFYIVEEESLSQDDSRLVSEDQEEDEENKEESQEPVKKKFKTKFDWATTIQGVLESKGPEMKVKKLRKKVCFHWFLLVIWFYVDKINLERNQICMCLFLHLEQFIIIHYTNIYSLKFS